MNKLLTVLSLTTAFMSVQALGADESYIYSNSEYCEISQTTSTASERRYLRLYSERLGYMPSRQECRTLRLQSPVNYASVEPFNFYRELRGVQRGSVRRLPQTTVQKISEFTPEAQQRALQAFTDGRASAR